MWLGSLPALKTVPMGREEMEVMLLATALALLAVVAHVTAGPETSQEEVLFQNCSSDRYVEGSNLGRNVKLVVESLVRNAPSTGVNTSSRGDHGERIYGLLQCRGDLRRSECARCASAISSRVLRSCGNSSGAIIQLHGCFLRYGTGDFFSQGTEGLKLLCTPGNVSRGASKGFWEAVQKLLYDVSIKAADNRGFWAQSLEWSGENIYGLAQCWGDPSRTACGSCLTFASSCALRCRSGAPGAQFLTQNCFVRFDTATSYAPAQRAETKKVRLRAWVLIVLAAVIGTALAVLCRILCKRARKPNVANVPKCDGILVKEYHVPAPEEPA